MEQKQNIEVGPQVYLEEGGEPCGAVREVRAGGPDEITIYVENAGEFIVPSDAVRAAHDGKVIIDRARWIRVCSMPWLMRVTPRFRAFKTSRRGFKPPDQTRFLGRCRTRLRLRSGTNGRRALPARWYPCPSPTVLFCAIRTIIVSLTAWKPWTWIVWLKSAWGCARRARIVSGMVDGSYGGDAYRLGNSRGSNSQTFPVALS